jgi:smad nuclear-interacting protein 1
MADVARRSRSPSGDRSDRHAKSRHRERSHSRDRDRGRNDKNDNSSKYTNFRDRSRDHNGHRERSRDRSRDRSHDRRQENKGRDRDNPRDDGRDTRQGDTRRERNEHRDRSSEKERKNRARRDDSREGNIKPRYDNPMHAARKSRVDNAYIAKATKDSWGDAVKEQEYEMQSKAAEGEQIPEEKKEKANFGLSGALAKDDRTGNMLNGVLLKFNEPLDAAVPTKNWRVYVFKEESVVEVMHLHRKSFFLVGRDQRIVDIHTAHPSCSKQHAVIQFRRIDRIVEDSDHNKLKVSEVKPYIIDLGSAHKTSVNGKEIEEARYYELLEKDCIRFGQSTRDYVLLHENSA